MAISHPSYSKTLPTTKIPTISRVPQTYLKIQLVNVKETDIHGQTDWTRHKSGKSSNDKGGKLNKTSSEGVGAFEVWDWKEIHWSRRPGQQYIFLTKPQKINPLQTSTKSTDHPTRPPRLEKQTEPRYDRQLTQSGLYIETKVQSVIPPECDSHRQTDVYTPEKYQVRTNSKYDKYGWQEHSRNQPGSTFDKWRCAEISEEPRQHLGTESTCDKNKPTWYKETR